MEGNTSLCRKTPLQWNVRWFRPPFAKLRRRKKKTKVHITKLKARALLWRFAWFKVLNFSLFFSPLMFSTQIVADDETEADNRSKSSDKLSRNTFWAHTEQRQLPETISSFTLWLRWILNVLRNERSSSGGNLKQTDVSVSTTVVNVRDAEKRGFEKKSSL